MMKTKKGERRKDNPARETTARASPGKREFREILAAAYEPAVRGTAGRLEIHFEDARDAVHTVIEGLLESRQRGRGRRPIRKPRAFLKKSAVGAYKRSESENGRLVLLSELSADERRKLVEETPGPGPDPAKEAAERETQRLAWHELSTLPQQQRRVVSLRSSKLAFGEISQILRITPGNARVHYHAGILELRRRFGVAA